MGAARSAREQLNAREAECAREIELLRLGLADIERVAPLPAEDAELDRELARLGAVDELRSAADAARGALAGADESAAGPEDGGALAGLVRAARALDAASGSDPELAQLAARAHEVCVLTSELAGDLGGYADGVEFDPSRLATAQARRAELTRLCRPHATDVDGVLRWAADAEARLLDLDVGGSRADELAEAEAEAARSMIALARQVSSARRAGAETFGARVTAELEGLGMTTARFAVSVRAATGDASVSSSAEACDPAGLGVDGADEVEFGFSAGTGMPLRPLGRAASGGELSRVVLALEVVLAGGEAPQSMVFDEVDAGVGGEAAGEIGRRLSRLAAHAQVVCVTHLSQVAAFADQHLVVVKRLGSGEQAGHTTVEALDRPERVRELSRMLGGVAESRLAQGHADELLTCADQTKAAPARRPAVRRRRPGDRVMRGAA